jgi:hypothetical protein
MNRNKNKLDVGRDSVVIGRVSGNVGNGSVVIGPTDERGNVILNQPMAIGRNAHASPGSIAIGAGASAGSDLGSVLDEIGKIIESTQEQNLKLSFGNLRVELEKPAKDPARISSLWEVVKTSATLNGAIGLVTRASELIRLITG